MIFLSVDLWSILKKCLVYFHAGLILFVIAVSFGVAKALKLSVELSMLVAACSRYCPLGWSDSSTSSCGRLLHLS